MDDTPRRFSKLALAAGVGGVLLAGGAAWLWTERMPIATSYIDDALKAANVPARYKLTRVGFRTQRIEDVRIGDPAHPDLVADWIEVRLGVGFGGVGLRAVDAGGVHLHGRLIDGRLSLGAIDQLLPKGPSTQPFALPDIDLTARGALIDLDTPQGTVRARIDGQGGLKDGFRGRALISANDLATGGCTIAAPRAALAIAIDAGQPSLSGPVDSASIACAGARITAPLVDLNLRGDRDLARWRGAAVVQRGAVMANGVSIRTLGGRIGFDASARAISGGGTMFADAVRYGGSQVGRIRLEGGYRYTPGNGQGSITLEAAADDIMADPATTGRLAAQLASAGAMPVGPVLAAWGEALQQAGRRSAATAQLAVQIDPGGGAIRVERIEASSASGAHLLLHGSGVDGLGLRWPQLVGQANVTGSLGGGGLPDVKISLRQARPGTPISGAATIAPYRTADAQLDFAPVSFGPDDHGDTLIATRVTMDGPLADGRIDRLSLPIVAHLRPRGVLAINTSCVPLSFDRLAAAGTTLGRTSLSLCPQGGAMFGLGAGGVAYGGARIDGPRLRGKVGDQPLALQAAAMSVDIGHPGFALDRLAVRLGGTADQTRLDVARIEGMVDRQGIGGSFDAAEGKIGVVPLLLSQGKGDWRLDRGVLRLKASLAVDDADSVAPRFNRLVVPDAALTLNGGYLTASGQLTEPRSHQPVARVEIRHSLQSGRGDANLDVKGLRFTKKGLQPDRITPLTKGMIADVEGEIAGQGRIVWAGGKVTSTGAFSTEGINLAAAFGPVTGVTGKIVFTDLLAMVTAPDQVLTIAEANPGVAVTDGVIHYRIMPDFRLAAEGAWPFAGGTLTLEPTVLDMVQPVARRLTFRIDGLDAGVFVQQLEFKNIAVTGKFDGSLPIVFDAKGGRIEQGQLKVRPGGGTLSYVGDVTNADLGTFARLAFDALKSMRYDRLTIDLDGSLDGEIVSKVHFDGTNDKPKETAKAHGILGRIVAPLTRLPFRFNITITAPFRGLVNSAQTFVDPSIVLRSVPVAPEAPTPANPLPDPIAPPTTPSIQAR